MSMGVEGMDESSKDDCNKWFCAEETRHDIFHTP